MLQRFIENFTYLGVFLMLFGAGLGLPIPEEAPVLAAGALAHEDVVRWWIALPVCILGVLSGDVVLYWIGHHWGEVVLDWRVGPRVLGRGRAERPKAPLPPPRVKNVFSAPPLLGVPAPALLAPGPRDRLPGVTQDEKSQLASEARGPCESRVSGDRPDPERATMGGRDVASVLSHGPRAPDARETARAIVGRRDRDDSRPQAVARDLQAARGRRAGVSRPSRRRYGRGPDDSRPRPPAAPLPDRSVPAGRVVRGA